MSGAARNVSRRTVLGYGLAAGSVMAALPSLMKPGVANAAGTVVLADHGRALSYLRLSADPAPDVTLAAAELSDHAMLAAGVEIRVGDGTGVPIYLDSAARLARPDLDVPLKPQEFRLVVEADGVYAFGGSPLGTRYAIYELLERAGFRWIMPGDSGTDVPPGGQLAVAPVDTRSGPYFDHRMLQGVASYPAPGYPSVDPTESKRWTERLRMDNVGRGAHGIPIYPTATNKTNPELFIHINGAPTTQLDVTKPEVLERAVAAARRKLEADPTLEHLNLSPNDGSGFGVTEWDVPGRIDPLYGELVVTDRYVRFLNLLLAELSPDYPDLKIAFYAYGYHMEPPVREKPDPRIVPVIAPIIVSRRTTIADANGWERRYILQVMRDWSALGSQPMYRGYLGNLADPAAPFDATRQLTIEIPAFADAGVAGAIRLESLQGWGHGGPAYYMAAKLFWDPRVDAAGVLNDYYRRAYGPAASAMREYYETPTRADASTDFTAGGIWDLQHILPANVVGAMETSLARAESIAAGAANQVYAARVAVARLAFNAGRAMLQTHQALLSGNFAQALQLRDTTKQAFDTAATHKPAAVQPFALRYIDRFLGNTIIDGLASSSAPNSVLSTAPETWQGLIDDSAAAESDEVYAADYPLASWTSLQTTSRTWSAQGLRYYKGHAWYACDLAVPEIGGVGGVELWLGLVDESARVWLNGNELPVLKSNGSFLWWRFDATAACLTGQPNRLVVKVANQIVDELGTGGLLGPAFLYSNGSDVVRNPLPAKKRAVPVPTGELVGTPAPRGSIVMPDDWELMLSSYGGVGRIGLTEPQIGSEHWRPYRISLGWGAQGLRYYRSGAIIRVTLRGAARLRSGRWQLQVPAADGTVEAWLDGQRLAVAQQGGPSLAWRFDLGTTAESVGLDATVAIAFSGGSSDPAARGIAGPIAFVR